MSALREFLSALDPEHLNRELIRPMNLADISYSQKYHVISSFEEFKEECVLYWNHILKQVTAKNLPNNYVDWYVWGDVEKALANEYKMGKLTAAYELALSQTFRPIRAVLIKHYAGSMGESYVGHILTNLIYPLSFNEKKELMEAYAETFAMPVFNRKIEKHEIGDMIARIDQVIRSHINYVYRLHMEVVQGISF